MSVPTSPTHEVTRLLVAWGSGDRAALDRLMPLVHEELRRLARHYMSRERPGHTLQSTALVNEAYLRLVEQEGMRWENRAHFFGIAARLMRQVLVDHARGRQAAKRGGEQYRLSLSEVDLISSRPDVNLLALDEALGRLEAVDPQKSRIIELRYFGGLGIEETAEVIGVSPAKVKRDWSMARAWLRCEIGEE
ncbi:MAG: sigma-70 family RNA polymerase sigma factor [Acidobacteria bacterium]|nr:sigma-70 family RNA polymerase sigma factor [Acidobacteriota bacterium]